MSQVTGDLTIYDFTDKYDVFEERRHGIDGCLYTFDEWQYEMFFKFSKIQKSKTNLKFEI